MAQYAPEQIDILGRMVDFLPLSELEAMQDAPSPERVIERIRVHAQDNFSIAANLIAQWDFWVRYEAGLADGRHDRAEAVAMMVYDIGKAIGSPADWSAPQPTTIANAYLEGRA